MDKPFVYKGNFRTILYLGIERGLQPHNFLILCIPCDLKCLYLLKEIYFQSYYWLSCDFIAHSGVPRPPAIWKNMTGNNEVIHFVCKNPLHLRSRCTCSSSETKRSRIIAFLVPESCTEKLIENILIQVSKQACLISSEFWAQSSSDFLKNVTSG